MKIECLKEKLEEALIKAERVTSKNVTLPVLKYILLVAKERTLIVRATNLDLGVEIKIPVKVDEEGVVAVPGDIFRSYISNLSNDSRISISTKDSKLSIITDKSETHIHTYSHEEFPSIPVTTSDTKITIPVNKFVNGLKSVWYSASVQSMKPELSSIYIYYEDDHLIYAATDSFRLAEKKVYLKKIENFEPVLIPSKNVSDIIKILEGESGDMELSITESQIGITLEGIYITSRIIDGIFPDYRQIIPKEYETEVVVLKQDVVDVLKRSFIFSDKFNRITFEIKPKEKHFRVITSNQDVGDSSNDIPAAINGSALTLNFNYKNIIDSFQSVTTDSLVFKFGDKKPLMIQGIGDSSFTYITMPMNK